jgi:RNA polymerase sigma-70 factor (ECF subfamily)
MATADVISIDRRPGLQARMAASSSAPMSEAATVVPATPDPWTLRLQRVAEKRDRQAFAELFAHFAPLLKAFALSSPGMSSNALAEELVQEVMLKVWNRASTFDSAKAGASTWIYTLARNCRIDLLRRRNRLREEVDVDELWDVGTPSDAPEADLNRERDRVVVGEALRTLPADQRQVIAKVYMEGKSHSEVADELGLPLGTVKSRIRLALSKLEVLLHR